MSCGAGMKASSLGIDWRLDQRLLTALLDRRRRLGTPELCAGIAASSRKHVSIQKQNFALLGLMECHLDDGWSEIDVWDEKTSWHGAAMAGTESKRQTKEEGV